MFAIATDEPQTYRDPLSLHEELGVILEMRRRLMESGELRHASVLARHLVEDEIPRLVAMVTGR